MFHNLGLRKGHKYFIEKGFCQLISLLQLTIACPTQNKCVLMRLAICSISDFDTYRKGPVKADKYCPKISKGCWFSLNANLETGKNVTAFSPTSKYVGDFPTWE